MTWRPVPNYGYPQGVSGRDGECVLAIVDHIAQGTAAGVYATFANPASQASAHYLVCRSGKIVQFVAVENAAWANGIVHCPDTSLLWLADLMGRGASPNLATVSIEHEGYSGQALTEEQYAATLELHRYLLARFGLAANRQVIVGHYQLDSVDRPNCPGGAFPWLRLLTDLRS